ncbi:MAG TPA: hypothetical protein V6D47_03225 [Oscillatoriaceae cyanobacterium]
MSLVDAAFLQAGFKRLEGALHDRLAILFGSAGDKAAEATHGLADAAHLSSVATKLPEDMHLDTLNFKLAAKQPLLKGGHLPKQIMTDRFGKSWLFKTTMPGKEYRALGDRAGSRIFDAIGLDTPKVSTTRLPANLSYKTLAGDVLPVKGDVYGNIQRMVESNGKALPSDVRKLTQSQIDQLTVSHVGRTLIFDNDGKAANFLTRPDGSIASIDLGNMYRYTEQGPLTRDYAPNPGDAPYYNKLWQGYVDGKINLDFSKGLRQVAKIEALPDDQFKQLLRPYAEARYAQGDAAPGYPTVESFLRMAVDRKQNMRGLMTNFYDGLAKARGLSGLDAALAKKP